MKNTTLLLKFHQIGKLGRPAFEAITPLFKIKAYRINLNQTIKQIANFPKINYTPRKTDFDRVLVIGADEYSNARRSVSINIKRDDLIQFINAHGKSSYMYTIHLSQINKFVPAEFLIQQMKAVMNQRGTNNYSKVRLQGNKYNVVSFRHNVLFPFNYTKWMALLKQTFPKYNSINYQRLQQNYFFMQISNLYMIQYAINQQMMYEDFRDFDAFLGKFNFIRYFWQVCASNQFTARKYSQRLIKNISWRTHQSQQYLLLLIRGNSWQRFILMVQDFCLCYQNIYQQKIKNQSNKNK